MKATRSRAAGTFVILVWVGCGGQHTGQRMHDGAAASEPHPRDEAIRNSVGSTTHRLDLIMQADQGLKERWPLDYRRPFLEEAYREDTLQHLYIEACRDGDKRSCWMAAMLEGWSPSGTATKQVIDNCVAGDVMSCRALPHRNDRSYGDRVLGSAGRSTVCTHPDLDRRCNMAALRQECSAGFPSSCMDVSRATDTDRDRFRERTRVLARAGCESGIKDECELLRQTANGRDDLVFGRLQLCILDISWCESRDYRERGDFIGARDSDERYCQHGRVRSFCFWLGQQYMEGVYQEPVPGRANSLITWACNDETVQRHEPTCKATAAGNATLRPASP